MGEGEGGQEDSLRVRMRRWGQLCPRMDIPIRRIVISARTCGLSVRERSNLQSMAPAIV